MTPFESDTLTGFAPKSSSFSIVYCETLPLPETRQSLPSSVSFLLFSISLAKYTQPYPVASGRISEPPQFRPLPVRTPVNSFRRRLYWPNRKPISRPPTPISPAGTSVSGPMCRHSSVMKLWQQRITSLSLLPLGSKSLPPLPPPMGSVVREFLKTCSNARNLRMPRLTEGWKRSPPL